MSEALLVAGDGTQCAGCTYDISRLARSGKCPECGISIETTIGDNALSTRSPAYRAKLQRGALIVLVALNLIGGAVLVEFLAFLSLSSQAVSAGTVGFVLVMAGLLALLIGFVLYSIGWWIFSAIDPDRRDASTKNRTRRFLRATTILVLMGAASYIAYMLIVPFLLRRNVIIQNSGTVTALKNLGLILMWGNPVLWGIQYCSAALYLRWISDRIPNVRAYRWASRLMRLGPILMAASFTLIAPIVALALLYYLVTWVYEDLKKMAASAAPARAAS